VVSESSFGGSPSESSVDFILGKTVNRARSSVHSSSSQTHLSQGGERLGKSYARQAQARGARRRAGVGAPAAPIVRVVVAVRDEGELANAKIRRVDFGLLGG
jgi:hypothetical protein